ncbi:DUF4365 domain-containing protein [Nocardioides sambongensis]|uniref:DUF4365 domain-containing protein n=1 Tax=Nocardioides sambongensis TaxID=2589074 RepID=UPI00112B14BF|nr:DUF4365 domain-containing protein [Nocardioides sambongensis]
MSDLPRVTETDFTEMKGVDHVAMTATRARCIWRPTPLRDVGIDGTIEYVTPEGLTPGRLIAVQVKAGESRFKDAKVEWVPFYPEKKHRTYWMEYPLPVILVLHHPVTGETIWVDARESLRASPDIAAIKVPRNQVFDGEGVLDALAMSGPLPTGQFDVQAVLAEMAQPEPRAQNLCYLYLFAQGMTDIATSLYVSVEVVTEILDVVSAEWDPPRWSLGEDEFGFLDRYLDFLVQHDLARIDYSAWRQARERELVGKLFAPLTPKGKAVRDAIIAIDDSLPTRTDPDSRAIVERFVQMIFNPTGLDEVSLRQERIELVRKNLAATDDAIATE